MHAYIAKTLREKQKSMRDLGESSKRQMKLWREVEALLQAKLAGAVPPSRDSQSVQAPRRLPPTTSSSSDRLVIESWFLHLHLHYNTIQQILDKIFEFWDRHQTRKHKGKEEILREVRKILLSPEIHIWNNTFLIWSWLYFGRTTLKLSQILFKFCESFL